MSDNDQQACGCGEHPLEAVSRAAEHESDLHQRRRRSTQHLILDFAQAAAVWLARREP